MVLLMRANLPDSLANHGDVASAREDDIVFDAVIPQPTSIVNQEHVSETGFQSGTLELTNAQERMGRELAVPPLVGNPRLTPVVRVVVPWIVREPWKRSCPGRQLGEVDGNIELV